MDLEQLKRNWEKFGRVDPLWAVLTDPERRGGRWDLDEFLATGESEVQAVFDELATLDVSVDRGRALDFGCGVGRLTQALADRFDRCDGVDIADSMIAEAERINRRGDRVSYHVNFQPDLTLFEAETFDFVLSFIALQHMEPRYASRYIAEFIRVLRPGGITIFQLPTGRPRAPITPLADGAWRATITRDGDPPEAVVASQPARVRARVRNDSPHTWAIDSHVLLGARWRDSRGRLLVDDPGRVDLHVQMGPLAEEVVDIVVRAPDLPGEYQLELDLIQEQAGWFRDHGSEGARLATRVVPASVGGAAERPESSWPPSSGSGAPSADAARSAAAARSAGAAEVDADTPRPVMEMYGIPPEQLRDALVAAGGEVLAQFNDERGGPQVEGFRYVVRRVAARTPPLPRPSLGYLDASLTEIPNRPDMFPPVTTRRPGIAGRLELSVRRKLGRALRPFTWVQAQHNRTVVEALHHIRDALAEQDAELRRLDQELARRGHGPREDVDADGRA